MYYLTLGCLLKPNDQYKDHIKTLFNLVSVDGVDEGVPPFFLRHDKTVFLELLA